MNDTGESNLSRMPNSNHEPSFNLLRQKQEKKVVVFFFFKLLLLTSILIYEKNSLYLSSENCFMGLLIISLLKYCYAKQRCGKYAKERCLLILVHASLNKDVYTQSGPL